MARITFKGKPVHTAGELPEIGSTAPDFKLVRDDLTETTLTSYKGMKKALNICVSVDTGVCAMTVKRFNQLAAALDGVVVLNISKDLPFAQKRFCGSEGIENVLMLSDFRGNFGVMYGVTLTDGPLHGLLSRAVVVLDENNTVLYSEQVSELSTEPDYEAALAALK
ncbi:thiol peroxidase [Candidatus Sumerlaeota bacterium]|nr:thiol peroxidase [Candidatus Sumerlaeota bacterium]